MGRDIQGLIIANGGDVTDEVIAGIARGKTPLVWSKTSLRSPCTQCWPTTSPPGWR